MTTTKREHGIPGHLNVYTLDMDDECTGKGVHRRCQVYGDLDESTREDIGVTVTCDLDAPHLSHLPIPTPSQALAVAMGERRVHPRGKRLVFHGTHEWANNSQRRLDFVFGF